MLFITRFHYSAYDQVSCYSSLVLLSHFQTSNKKYTYPPNKLYRTIQAIPITPTYKPSILFITLDGHLFNSFHISQQIDFHGSFTDLFYHCFSPLLVEKTVTFTLLDLLVCVSTFKLHSIFLYVDLYVVILTLSI